jgi:hypothetical protein
MKTRLIAAGVICLIVFGCDNAKSPEMAKAWQENMREGLVPGYANFTAHWVDSDITAYIFSYTCPAPLSGKEIFSLLQGQIPKFQIDSQNETTLVLRYPISYSGPGGLDEWRFMYDKETRVMTVLFANLDSEVERRAHSFIVRKVERYHDEEVRKRKTH